MTISTEFKRSAPAIVKGAQVRAARALLDWSISRTAECCAIGVSTIARLESGERSPGEQVLQSLVRVFEENGVLFIDTASGVGVVLVERHHAHISDGPP